MNTTATGTSRVIVTPDRKQNPNQTPEKRYMNTVNELTFQRKLNRNKVLEFEREIEEKLLVLQRIEISMNDMNKQREEWLENIANSHTSNDGQFQQKMQLISLQCNLTSWNVKLDMLRLDAQYESQYLSSLVSGTRPLEANETMKDREEEIKARSREDSESIKESIRQSLEYRIQLSNFLYQLINQVKELKLFSQNQIDYQIGELEKHLNTFRETMFTLNEQATRNYQSILQEYLVLRHNSNMIKEILVRNQNQAIHHRNTLNIQLEKILKQAKEKHEKLEFSTNQEIVLLTKDLRQEIMSKERLAEELRHSIVKLQKEKVYHYSELKKEIAEYDLKYISLERKRKNNLIVILKELEELRGKIHTLERQLYSTV